MQHHLISALNMQTPLILSKTQSLIVRINQYMLLAK